MWKNKLKISSSALNGGRKEESEERESGGERLNGVFGGEESGKKIFVLPSADSVKSSASAKTGKQRTAGVVFVGSSLEKEEKLQYHSARSVRAFG